MWKIIAKFNYKDKFINYVGNIRARRFKLVCTCAKKDEFNGRCRSCGKPLSSVIMYCAYIAKGEPYIDVAKILSVHTHGTWKYLRHNGMYYSRKIPSAVMYAISLDQLYKSLELVNFEHKGVEVKMEFIRITEVDMDKCVELSENNKLLREL